MTARKTPAPKPVDVKGLLEAAVKRSCAAMADLVSVVESHPGGVTRNQLDACFAFVGRALDQHRERAEDLHHAAGLKGDAFSLDDVFATGAPAPAPAPRRERAAPAAAPARAPRRAAPPSPPVDDGEDDEQDETPAAGSQIMGDGVPIGRLSKHAGHGEGVVVRGKPIRNVGSRHAAGALSAQFDRKGNVVGSRSIPDAGFIEE